MNIKGKKVLLRALEKEDLEFLREMINDPEMEKDVVGWSFPVSKIEQEKWFENQIQNKNNIRYIIEVDKKRIGLATITNIDWKNRKACHGIKLFSNDVKGKGYGTDTVNTIMKYAFEELQLNKLYSTILEYNVPSINLYKKCGWSIDGTLRESTFKQNRYVNELAVSILKKDYEERNYK